MLSLSCRLLGTQLLVVIALVTSLSLASSFGQSLADDMPSKASDEKKLRNQFQRKIFPLLVDSEKGCVECHRTEGTSNLVLSGNARDDLHILLDQQYLKSKGSDTLLRRVTTDHNDRRMPKEGQTWSKRDVQKLRSFLHLVEDLEQESGVASDEVFPRSLLSEYRGPKPQTTENQFLTYRQLKGKIQTLFEDDWVRGDRDLFAENVAMFGGADFKTRFDESSQPSATFLTGLELLARDVANRAYELRSGPFRNWPVPVAAGEQRDLTTSATVDAIEQLYMRLLFRRATEQEISQAKSLLKAVFELESVIQKRDDELGFELTVRDPETGLKQQEVVRIPVSGERLQVRQWLVDQTIIPTSAEGESKPKSLCRVPLGAAVPLEAKAVDQRLMIYNVGTLRNVSFAGLDIFNVEGQLVQSIAVDSPQVEVEGAWQIADEDGFKSFEDRNQHKGMSSIRVGLSVPSDGQYQLVLLLRSDVRNARHVLTEIYSPLAGNQLAMPTLPAVPDPGEARFYFDCSNDANPFASPKASFQFDEQGSVELSNRGTLDSVTAGAVEFIRTDSHEPSFLIDSKDAEGNTDWKRYDEGRFKAYNVKGVKLHDGNTKKGELSLIYKPKSKLNDGWIANDFYQLRLYYPGKKEQEVQVPVIVRAKNSSPIIQLAYPQLAKADAVLRLDASASYTVAHGKLEFAWRQISGMPVTGLETGAMKSSPVLEFTAPRRSVVQTAWVSLCAALMRHPDFLFTRPPSLANATDPVEKQRLRLVKLALDLVGRPPRLDEVQQLENGVTLETMVDRFLDSQEFRDFYFHRIRLYLESQGTEVQDEPARIWSYIALNDRPFQEILTADYTVDSKMEKATRPSEHGKTGLLTAPGFIQGKPGLPHYNYAAQVSMLFLGYVYEVPPEIVEQREGVTALGTTDPNSVCYSCHKILTPLSFQRLNWNDSGEFRKTNEDGLTIDATDQKSAEDYPFPGNGMEAFASGAVKKERFIRTILNTHVNFYFGRPMRFREDERELYKRLWDTAFQSNFKLRSVIRAIVTSPEYLQ